MLPRNATYKEWLASRPARRASSKLVEPGSIQRKSSSSDKRLSRLYNGKRGLPFARL